MQAAGARREGQTPGRALPVVGTAAQAASAHHDGRAPGRAPPSWGRPRRPPAPTMMARLDHQRHADGTPDGARPGATPLPPCLAAALAAVVRAVVRSVLAAAEGSAIGADVSQWRLAWADELCRLWNGAPDNEEYYRRAAVWRGRLASKPWGEGGRRPGGWASAPTSCGRAPPTCWTRMESTTRGSCLGSSACT